MRDPDGTPAVSFACSDYAYTVQVRDYAQDAEAIGAATELATALAAAACLPA